MTCSKEPNRLGRKMGLEYFNSLMRRSASMRSDIRAHNNVQDEESDDEKSSEGKPLKSGFLNNIKQRFQRRFTGVRSKYRSKMRKSSSLNDSSQVPGGNTSAPENSAELSPNRAQETSESTLVETGFHEGLGTQSLSGHLLQLSKYGWYWGPMTREEAEEKLANQPEGSFLVIIFRHL